MRSRRTEPKGPSLVSMMRRVSRTVLGDQSLETDATWDQRSRSSPKVVATAETEPCFSMNVASASSAWRFPTFGIVLVRYRCLPVMGSRPI